ncbi:MAG: hypothetical protein V1728_05200 [Candidatus Micrarchaeota archaeon]
MTVQKTIMRRLNPEELLTLQCEITTGASPTVEGKYFSVEECLEKLDLIAGHARTYQDPNAVAIIQEIAGSPREEWLVERAKKHLESI